jgi:hypothetical protein
MGLYTFQLKCGCVELTSTLEKEPKTFTLSYCKDHKPPEDLLPNEKETTKTEKSKNQKDPNK